MEETTLNVSLKEASDEVLASAVATLQEEIERRRFLKYAELHARELNERYIVASGLESGTEWKQPTGAHNAYPEGFEVTHKGKTWVSTVATNVWEPGVSGWREKTAEGSIAEYRQPTGAHDAYALGDKVLFKGTAYESTIPNNVWSPEAYPSGWKKIG